MSQEYLVKSLTYLGGLQRKVLSTSGEFISKWDAPQNITHLSLSITTLLYRSILTQGPTLRKLKSEVET